MLLKKSPFLNTRRALEAFASALLLAVSLPASASNSATLSWAPNPESNISGYRIHYGTNSGQHTEILDAGNSTSTNIDDLDEGQLYYCALTAYNVVGLESTKSEEIAVIIESVGSEHHLVVLEPETGTVSGSIFIGVELDEFFQPSLGFIETEEGSDEGHSQLTFTTPTSAAYTVWARVIASGPSNDSIFIGINSPSDQAYDLDPLDENSPGEWTWERVESSPGTAQAFPLSEGEHTLLFSKCDPGVLIDRLVLSSDPAFIPDDTLINQPDVVVITTQPKNTAGLAGSPVTLGISVISTSSLNYQWMKDGEPIPDATSSSLILTSVQEEQLGSYSVEIQTTESIVVSESATVSITPSDPRIVSFQLLRENSSASVAIEVSGTPDGSTVMIQGSSDMLLWQSLGSGTIGDLIIVGDPLALSATRRFYRVQQTHLP